MRRPTVRLMTSASAFFLTATTLITATDVSIVGSLTIGVIVTAVCAVLLWAPE